jgi:predicted permease
MRSLLDDLRHAVRALAKRPRFLLAVVAPLALGIGANTAIFAIVDAVLFRPLPVRAPAELRRVQTVDRSHPDEIVGTSYPLYVDYRDQATAFSGLAAYSDPTGVHATVDGRVPERVTCMIVSGNYFEVLGVGTSIGRGLGPSDDAAGATNVVVISDRYWQTRFGGDPGALGSVVRVGGAPFTIVGVANAEFSGIDLDSPGGRPDLWFPISSVLTVTPEIADLKPLERDGFGWLSVVGRVAPGASTAQGDAQLTAAAEGRIARRTTPREFEPVPRVVPANEAALAPSTGETTTNVAWLLFGIVGCVLLIACADAAGVLVARGEERQREIAIRQAIGASRWRIMRQLVLENLIVALVAAAAGLLVATWMTSAFEAMAPISFMLSPETVTPVTGSRVLAFAVGVAMVVGLVFGTLPALRASSVQLVPSLKSETRQVTAAGFKMRLRSVFLAIQVALSVVLLAGAGVLLQSLWNAYHTDAGYDADRIATAAVDLGRQGYDRERGERAFAEILERVRATPGVESASLARSVPIHRGGIQTSVEFEGREPDPEAMAELNPVVPGFFDTIGVPLLQGRDLSPADTKDSPEVVVVNRAFAERYWPGENPIGKRITNWGEKGAEVVGVVADYRMRSLRDPAPPALFVSHAQFYVPRMTIVAKTTGDPAVLLPAISAAVLRVDPELPAYDAGTGEQKLGVALARERIVALLLVAFAGLAMLLSAMGFYGAFSYSTRLRSHEFAIRVALGAQRGDLIRIVIRGGVLLAVVGVAGGLAASYGLSGVLSSLVFGLQPADPVSFAAAALALVTVAAVACYVPARRAARVDPAAALRAD